MAAAAPEFRARAIWLTGSNTTVAPPPRAAISAVRSVELLSHTINSTSQPRRVNAPAAALICASDSPSNRSSLNAGMTMDILNAGNVAANVGSLKLLTRDNDVKPAHIGCQLMRIFRVLFAADAFYCAHVHLDSCFGGFGIVHRALVTSWGRSTRRSRSVGILLAGLLAVPLGGLFKTRAGARRHTQQNHGVGHRAHPAIFSWC